jgi:hypothetical protein
MIVVSDGQFTLPEETTEAEPKDRSAAQAPEPAGQMFMIRKGVEACLREANRCRCSNQPRPGGASRTT